MSAMLKAERKGEAFLLVIGILVVGFFTSSGWTPALTFVPARLFTPTATASELKMVTTVAQALPSSCKQVDMAAQELQNMIRIDKPVEPLVLSLYGGGETKLADLRGKIVLINFWASWCIPCRKEAPAMECIWQAYRDKGVVFLGVDIQDREADALGYIQKLGLTYPTGFDTTGKISRGWRVWGVPTTFLVSKEGKLIGRWVGPINERTLIESIESLLRR